jgi:hypothetical protein
MALLRQGQGCSRFKVRDLDGRAHRRGAHNQSYSRWSEIDMLASKWTLPAERMKSKRVHRVALSSAPV